MLKILLILTRQRNRRLGVLPREKWDKKRQDELMNGIYNYIAVDKLPPLEWLEELIEILGRMEKTNE